MRVTFVESNDSFSWNVIDLLPVDRDQVEVVRGGTPEAVRAVREAEVVVVGPGPTDPQRAGLLGLVTLAAEQRTPLLGICLGHQAVGLSFGATLRRTPPAHGRVVTCVFEASRSFPGLEGPREVMRYHSLSLEEVRAPLRVIGRAEGLVMAIEHESLPMAGLQFHPDSYATREGRAMVEAFFSAHVGQRAPRRGRIGPTSGVRAPAVAAAEVPPGVSAGPASLAGDLEGARVAPLVRLSELEACDSFVLLGPGFTGAGWALLSPGAGRHRVVLRPYSSGGGVELTGALTPVALELDVAPAALPVELDERGFVDGVAAIREAIAAGDVYQVNLTQRATVRCERGAQLLATLCRRGVPRFGAWVKVQGQELISASPELLFERSGQVVRVEPMKGTAAPNRRRWLELSEKDRSELAMITDLLRDDLHRLCVPRSVEVEEARRFIELPYALQTVSDVRGELRAGVGLEEVLAQLHPGGSVTGAPRRAACELIARLEASPRGAYCGTLGLVGPGDETARFSLLIRTATRTSAHTWEYGVGCGVTWESDALSELEEVRLKLGALR